MPESIDIHIEIQDYGSDEQTTHEILEQIRDTVVSVISLCDLSVGTFVTSRISEVTISEEHRRAENDMPEKLSS